jgi:hypothetical protein
MSPASHTTLATVHRLVAINHGTHLSDARGVQDSPAKMIWIAAAIVIAGLRVRELEYR